MHKKFQTKHISDTHVCLATDMFEKATFERQKVIYDYLHEMTGAPINVCFRAMERAHRRGLIEYGVSLRMAWLTELGEFTVWLHDVTKENKGFMLDLAYGYWKMLQKDCLNIENKFGNRGENI